MSQAGAFAGNQAYSVVIPIHNEARILKDSVSQILRELDTVNRSFEVILYENGSRDETLALARDLEHADARVRVLTDTIADYGAALKRGIGAARCDVVVIFNIDYWSSSFVERALAELGSYDLVIGSKAMVGSIDERPWLRRAITLCFNLFLQRCFGFRGSDTHGLKAFRRHAILPVLDRCVTDGWIFDTELVLLAERLGLRIVEVPVRLDEIRAPGYQSLVARVPRTIRALIRLQANLRQQRRDLPVSRVGPIG